MHLRSRLNWNHAKALFVAMCAALMAISLAVLATGCGAAPPPEFVDLSDDVIFDDSEAVEVPWGTSVDEASEKDGSVTKSATEWVFFPYGYGMHGGKGYPHFADWTGDCRVANDRVENIWVDPVTCGNINDPYWYEMRAAVDTMIIEGMFWIGWRINRVSTESAASIRIRCNDWTVIGAKATLITAARWNVPGHPFDLAILSNTCPITFALQAFETIYADPAGEDPFAKRLINNMVRHEILHCMGMGHYSGATDIMNTNQPDHVLTQLSAEQRDDLRNYRHGVGIPAPAQVCNWLVGDIRGDACPNGHVW